MIFLFTKNNKIGSRFIRLATGEPCSHFAVLFKNSVVLHSTFNGVSIEAYRTFRKKHNIVSALSFKNRMDPEVENDIFRNIVFKYIDKSYDYMAFSFFIVKILAKRMFKRDIYKTNLWDNRKKYICTELAEAFSKIEPDLFEIEWPEKFGALTPQQLYIIMSRSDKLDNINID